MGYGFTEGEVKKLIQQWRKVPDDKIEEVMKGVREYYNGYQVQYEEKKISIYNPTSIIKYLHEGKIGSYWVDTGEYQFLNHLHNEFPNKALEIAEKIQQNVFEAKIEKSLSIVDILGDPNKMWTLLFFSGYITQKLDDIPPEVPGNLRLQVPNKEVREAYLLMSKRFEILMDKAFQSCIRQALQKFDLPKLFEKINEWISSAEMSGHAYSDETAYRATVRTLLRVIVEGEWDILEEIVQTDNQNNRSDLIVVPKKQTTIKKAYIFEFKFLPKDKNREKSLKKKLAEAQKQILEKEYWKLIQSKKNKYDIDQVLGVGAVGCACELTFSANLITEYKKFQV